MIPTLIRVGAIPDSTDTFKKFAEGITAYVKLPSPRLLSCIIWGDASPSTCIEKLNYDGVLSKVGTCSGVTIRSTSTPFFLKIPLSRAI